MVQGINLITPTSTEGDRHIPLDYRLYEKSVDGATKNDRFRAMLAAAKERRFAPECVVFDSWYSSLDNLKLIRSYEWSWLTRLKRNRHVNPDGKGNRPLSEVEIAATGSVVHLKGDGMVKVCKIVTPDGLEVCRVTQPAFIKLSVGVFELSVLLLRLAVFRLRLLDIDSWATNDLKLLELRRLQLAEFSWAICRVPSGTQAVLCGRALTSAFMSSATQFPLD